MSALGHVDCECWRCAEDRGEEDIHREWRSREADPTKCEHPPDTRDPISGDGWLCGVCGDYCDAPPAEHLMAAGDAGSEGPAVEGEMPF